MKTFDLRLSPKIGDILYGKAHLDKICHLYDVVNVGIQSDMYCWRASETVVGDMAAYHEFMTSLYKWLFSEKNYCIHMDRSVYMHMDWPAIYCLHKFDPVKPNLRSYLEPYDISLPDEYIVIMTKSVWFDVDEFNKNSAAIWNSILAQTKSRKIVVMGEQEVEPCHEKRLHKAGYFSMYPLIMEHVPHESIIDLTVPGLGITSPTFAKFQSDCWIASKAKACLTFGYGGAFCMATSFGKSISYLNRGIGWVHDIFHNGFSGDCLATNDIGLWCHTLDAT